MSNAENFPVCGQTVGCIDGQTGVISAAQFQPQSWPTLVSVDRSDETGNRWTGERFTAHCDNLYVIADAPRDRSFWQGC